jgi:pimeloyl-ACP methyl ester carboxylesterase
MTTYVLVHGAWGGAQTWRTVRPLLRAEGHDVFTPSLTGIGERQHLTSPQISLSTHIDDVCGTIHFEGLDDIVLLGFSYGGMVVTGALEHVGNRVRELVYLDAMVPADGQSAADLFGPMPTMGPGDDWAIDGIQREFEIAGEAEFHVPRRSRQPIRTLTEPVRLAKPLEEFPFGRTYVKATGDPRLPDRPNPFWEAADRYRDDPAWRYHESTSNHMIPQNRPGELAELLLELA